MTIPEKVRLIEVAPRDGLQNLASIVPPVGLRVELIEKLTATGLNTIEVGSFVSPKKVPQMACTEEVLAALPRQNFARYSALVANSQGYARARATGIQEIAVFTAASDLFCQRNIGCDIQESLRRFADIFARAKEDQIRVRGYISCVLGCPYAGEVEPALVAKLAKKLFDAGCYEISLGDTLGIGTPLRARKMFQAVRREVPVEHLAAHFHDTYGQAIANLYVLLEEGLRAIDAATGGLGGCPYAPGAAGNVAMEDVLYLLEGLGVEHEGDLQAVAEIGRWICDALHLDLRSKTGQALHSKKE